MAGKPAIARRLGMSPRTLQRHLAGKGTTFKDLVADARMQLARNHLEERASR